MKIEHKVEEHGIYIAGEWIKSCSGETFPSLNPATEEVIGYFQKAVEEEVSAALDAAEEAQAAWAELPAPKRGEILLNAAKILREEKERLAMLETTEMGKILEETRGDVQEAIDVFEYMAGEGRRLFGRTTPSELPDKVCMTFRLPIGICALITPWNFPIAIPAWKLAPALICGNPVVLKPSSDSPLCAVELVKILERAGVPKGVVNLVTGKGEEVGAALVRNKKVAAISFTGHRDTGKWIMQNAASAGIKRVGLELGSKNAAVVLDDADLNLAVDGVLWGAFGTTGQRCTAASRVIVHEKIRERFEKMLIERVKQLKVGPGYEPGVDMGPLINRAALEKTQKYAGIGKEEGATMLWGGKSLGGKGYFHQPTVFTDVSIEMKIAREEIFGPVLSIIPASDFDSAIRAVNSVEYGLSSSVYTGSIRNAFRAVQKIEAGITYVNAPTIGAEVHLPFGGVKNSGNAREAGWTGIEEFSNEKTVYIDYSGRLQKAQGIRWRE